jgi:hypothetical protein
MSLTFTMSEILLTASAFTAASWSQRRSVEAAIGFGLLGLASLNGALLWLDLSVLASTHQALSAVAGLWSIPLVGVAWVLVRIGEEGPTSGMRTLALMVAIGCLGALFGDAWRTLGGVTAILVVASIAREANPNHPGVKHGLIGAAVLLVSAALGTEGDLLFLPRVVWFHLLLAVGNIALASGLRSLPGSLEHRG